ncbi:MAG: hypothetical protein ABJP34_07795 [Erythrobacter sp.]
MPFRILAGLFGLVMAVYLAWGWYDNSGLYAWFVRWQADTFGSVHLMLTIFGLGAPLVFMPLGIAFRNEGRREKTPGEIKKTALRSGGIFLVLGLISSAVGYGAYSSADEQSDEAPEPVEVNVTTVGDDVPDAPVFQLVGNIPNDDLYIIEEEMRATTSYTFYAPIVADGYKIGEDEIRFIKVVSSQAEEPPAGRFSAAGSVSNSQPPLLIKDMLEKDGHKLADDLYQVSPGGFGTMTDRDTYWMAAAIAGFLGLMFLVIGITSLIKGAFMRG